MKAPTAPDTAETIPPGAESVLSQMLAMNGEQYAAPGKNFRPGHVVPTRLPASVLTKTGQGFSIAFPSKASITTPAVYRDKVFVSGGFRSKEFYAFHAKTGQSAWGLALDDDGPSSPACADGDCVFGTESCTLFSVEADTGKLRWAHWLGDPLTSAPALAKGRVFASYPAGPDESGKPRPPEATHALAAFDQKTGKVLWQRWLDSDVMSAPVAAGDFVYVATFGGTIAKLYQDSGKFKYAIRARATSAPVVLRPGQGDKETMFYTRRVDAEKPAEEEPVEKGSAEKPVEKKTKGTSSRSAPPAEEAIIRMDDNDPKVKYKAAEKGAVYLEAETQAGSAYDKDSKANDSANGFSGGAPAAANSIVAKGGVGVSSVSSMQAFQGSRVLFLGARNVNTMGDEVVATDVESGKKLWSVPLPGDLRQAGGALGTAPLRSGKSVLVATLAGKVLRLNPANGKVEKTYEVGSSVRAQPVVEDGFIYVGTEDGRLVVIDTKDPSLDGWPMWGANAARTGVTGP